jgi:hypothetical protein
MEWHDENNGVKDRILDDLGKSIKLVRKNTWFAEMYEFHKT